jgi:hypothetical protein
MNNYRCEGNKWEGRKDETGLIPVKLLHHMEDFARAPIDSYG